MPTGRHCTRCGRAACNDCLVQADVGSHCLECVRRARPPASQRLRFWNAGQPILVTKTIIAINAVVFLWTGTGGGSALFGTGNITQHEYNLALAKVFVANGDWYRLISAGFLHFGLLHIAMNMLLLYQLGQIIEPAVGRGKFLLLYFAALIGGSTGALMLSPNVLTGGASGAVFGLMAAAAVGLHQRGINPFRTGIGATLIINLVITFSLPGISVGGHLGGAVIGAAVGYAMLEPNWRRTMPWASWVAPVVTIVGCLAVVHGLL